ncbi:putative bifunctional diguanylate cyclase/phosphodiesterase [Modestobacter sp. VKM Ac-2986]|uniref:putative bifunctional diguanylate cyclase/phosphodiesterase n=1 Tax=Modestobacter sp. VKM Ac-2986 TaxID=3004140 RepID=UPI0022AA0599|nr:bifunctional diguanylate cyclase/phosphodiesterase [Modestobacter sp. VKM Ac-2986]
MLTTVLVRGAVAEADAATGAEAAVSAVAQLEAARSSVEHEIIPVLSIAVLRDPAAVALTGLPTFLVRAQLADAQGALTQAQQVTDAAIASVPAGSVGAEVAERAAVELAAVRSGASDQQASPMDTYTRYLAVSDMLMAAQRDAASAAGAHDVSAGTDRATRDVELVARLARTASRAIPLFLSTQTTVSGTEGPDLDWRATWRSYTDARAQMDELAQPALVSAWDDVRTSEALTAVDDVLAAQADDAAAAPISILQVAALVSRNTDRDAALAGLLQTAVGSAQAAAAADHDAADGRRDRTLLAALGVLLAATLGAALLGRSISRSLRVLAGQADRVSRGELVEVEGGGPREVRTVSTALGSAVASLRRIQAQSAAVAGGDLTSPVLEEPLPGPLGEVVHASVQQIVESVRERERLQFALTHQATHDPLTGLSNRAQARVLVNSALHRAQRSGGMTGLLFVDLDGFKSVNDGFGHAHGDAVLQEVARRLLATVRSGDVVCRLGGDEFVVLVEQVAEERDLVELAERIVAVTARAIDVGADQVWIGASVGVAVARDAGTDADLLFAEADAAAYRAKGHGRGRAEVFDEALRAELSARAELESAITSALRNGEMQLHYQPVLDVATSRLTGYEALIRWNRPGHGMVPPDSFIPTAEATRLICELDRWVLNEATRQLAQWRAEDPTAADRTLAVNISGRHLAEAGVVDDVLAALAASGFPAELLIVEVTETVLVDDPAAISNLAVLRSHGVSIAIDDFGTGFTSIGQLRSMPVDTLKIDRSFIASAEAGNRELVALIIRAAHTFGLTVVAEGVEEVDQLELLRADACDLVQGYLLSRPLPAAAVSSFRDGAHAPVA